MRAVKLVFDFRSKIKSEYLAFRGSFARIGDSDFRFLIKISAILILLPLIIAIFTEGSPISTIAFWVFVTSGLVLFFVWLGYLAKSIFVTTFGVASKTANTAYEFVTTPKLELSFHYLIFKIKDIYINWGYRLISLIDPPPLPKKGERIESWLKRIKPMQAYRVCKARILNSKNWMDYLDSIGIDRLIDFERFKRQKEYAKYQKQLNEAEKWMRRAIERMERH